MPASTNTVGRGCWAARESNMDQASTSCSPHMGGKFVRSMGDQRWCPHACPPNYHHHCYPGFPESNCNTSGDSHFYAHMNFFLICHLHANHADVFFDRQLGSFLYGAATLAPLLWPSSTISLCWVMVMHHPLTLFSRLARNSWMGPSHSYIKTSMLVTQRMLTSLISYCISLPMPICAPALGVLTFPDWTLLHWKNIVSRMQFLFVARRYVSCLVVFIVLTDKFSLSMPFIYSTRASCMLMVRLACMAKQLQRLHSSLTWQPGRKHQMHWHSLSKTGAHALSSITYLLPNVAMPHWRKLSPWLMALLHPPWSCQKMVVFRVIRWQRNWLRLPVNAWGSVSSLYWVINMSLTSSTGTHQSSIHSIIACLFNFHQVPLHPVVPIPHFLRSFHL